MEVYRWLADSQKTAEGHCIACSRPLQALKPSLGTFAEIWSRGLTSFPQTAIKCWCRVNDFYWSLPIGGAV